MNLEAVLTVGAAGGGVWLGAAALRSSYEWLYHQYRRWQHDNIQAEREKLKNAKLENEVALGRIRHIPAGEGGRQGIVYNGREYINLDSYAVFNEIRVQYFDPLMEQMNAMQKTLLALQGVNGPAARQMLEAQASSPTMMWPGRVRLADLFGDRRPSIHDLVIGVRPKDEGGLDVVSVGVHELMHTLAVGVSGWGKSTWLRALLWQIAQAQEAIEVVAVDAYGSEFNVLRDWSRLRWPVARSSEDAKAVLAAVSDEIERRKRLFEDNAPIASKLVEYNQATGAGLPPWLVVIDEGTALLNQPGVGEPLRAAVQTARQYGVYILVAGQSAKHSVIDTQIRDNFTSRLCFRTSPTSSRVVLDDKAASELTKQGRMYAQLVGRPLVELQGPFVSRQEFMRALKGGGPKEDIPEDEREQDELIRQLYAQGVSKRQIQHQIFGYIGGAAHTEVNRVLEEE